MKDLINLQIFRVSITLGILVSLLFFLVIAPSFKTTSSKESTDTACDEPAPNEQATEHEDIKATIKDIKKASRSKRNKLANLLKVLKSILEEELNNSQIEEVNENVGQPVKEILDSEPQIENFNGTVEESICKDALNESFDCSKILERITGALERFRAISNERKTKESVNIMPLFKKTSEDSFQPLEDNIDTMPLSQCLKSNNQLENMPPIPMAKLTPIDSSSGQKRQYVNSVPNTLEFIIPCQRTSDILDDSYLIPKVIYSDTNCNTNPKPVVKMLKYNLKQVNPISNAANRKEDNTVAMLLKPAALSLMQVYGNLLKKLTVTVLVPYYVSKLGL